MSNIENLASAKIKKKQQQSKEALKKLASETSKILGKDIKLKD